MRRPSFYLLALIPFVLHCSAAVAPDTPAPPSQTSLAEVVSMTGEVVAVDPASREVTLRGPLGGEVSGRVGEDVKNLAQVKVGDMVSIAYYQSVAISAAKKGEANPLFTGGETETAAPGEKPGASTTSQRKRTVTVVSVDPAKRSVVFQGEDGTLFPVEVERPELAKKLETLRAGDQLDVVVTEALITSVTPAAPGEKPAVAYEAATLIVDRGEVVRRVRNTLYIRNERGRIVKVTVDPDFKFILNGGEATVFDIEPGTKLTRTAFRVVDSASYEAE